ncbi:hypothetical protein LOK49_LG15G02006 [Camellia lanceoleosa]|uniref:Uncharacterized protein n=1 Tax=Camellia lanceoleosa TaxID=1840588 RepID=A0ACC0F2C8_9ERIC|nr:hypothetical protein LOK49_LG15G02006 [Camellia lanceoleosa]
MKLCYCPCHLVSYSPTLFSSGICEVSIDALKVESLKAQSNIVSKEIHSIDIDPSCPYQLAFHLDDGWSGILDIHNFQVTHVHCPPPPWLDGENVFTNLSCLRKPSWLPPYSVR